MNGPGEPTPTNEMPIPVVVEVTNTLSVEFTTGIQRVVREIVRGLAGPAGAGLEVIPVVQPRTGRPFRRLTVAEAGSLRTHPAGGRAGRRADDLGPLAGLARRVGELPVTLRLRATVANARRRRREHLPEHRELELPSLGAVFPEGAVFLDVEGSWYDPTPRSELLPDLADGGFTIVAFLHDVMPLVHPEWFAPLHVSVYREWLSAHLTHSDAFLANSRRTAQDLRDAARELGIDRRLDITVVPLGADPPGSDRPAPPDPAPSGLRYLLVVGTLEPRKNQATVLDAFDRLSAEFADLGLVLVGKEGWMVDDLVGRLRRHPLRDTRVLWLGGVDDAQLSWLYDHAFVVVAPSRYEGLGVPVLEALARGRATVASTGGAQPEAAGGAAETFEPLDVDELAAILRRHLTDPSHHAAAVAAAVEQEAPLWDDTAAAVADAIRRHSYDRRRPPPSDHHHARDRPPTS